MCSRFRSVGGNSGGWGSLAPSSARFADRKSALVVRPPVRRRDRGTTLGLLLPLLCCCGVRGLFGVCSCTTLLLRLWRLLTLPTLPTLPCRRIGCCSGVWYPLASRGWLLGRPGDFTGSSPWYPSILSSSANFRTGVSGRSCRTCSGFISSRGVPCLEPMVRASSAPRSPDCCPAIVGDEGPPVIDCDRDCDRDGVLGACKVGSSSSNDQDRGVGSWLP